MGLCEKCVHFQEQLFFKGERLERNVKVMAFSLALQTRVEASNDRKMSAYDEHF